MDAKAILSVENLTKQYVKGVSAVDDISFSLKEGSIRVARTERFG